jgi:hypothetical protein
MLAQNTIKQTVPEAGRRAFPPLHEGSPNFHPLDRSGLGLLPSAIYGIAITHLIVSPLPEDTRRVK